MAKRFDISILKKGVTETMDEMGRIGLCMRRFRADVIMDEDAFDALEADAIIEVDERKVRIVKIGKECFDGCELNDAGSYCPLKNNCAFGMWMD
jgi:hypothetical protein